MTQYARKLDKATDEFIEAIGIAMEKLANCCSLIDEAGDDGPESIAETNMLLLDFFLLVKPLGAALACHWDGLDSEQTERYLTEAVEASVEVASACLLLRFHNRQKAEGAD